MIDQSTEGGGGQASGSRVLLGLSGGVDSMASAILLEAQGYDVTAVTLWTWQEDMQDQSRLERARNSARRLGIPHRILDVRQAFYDRVITPFVDDWKQGLTPNPCVMCNPEFKFRTMKDLADELDCQYLATGHYARLSRTDAGSRLMRAAHHYQDQSYFLYRLPAALLDRLLFPVGTRSKDQVRQLAGQYGDPVADVRDSQDLCFIGKNQLKDFLFRQGVESGPGSFVDVSDQVIGQHSGSWQFTIGQRRHLGQSFGRRMTVLAIDHQRNRVTLGEEEEAFTQRMWLTDLVFPADPPDTMSCLVQLRSQGKPLEVSVTINRDRAEATLEFQEPARITSPGQSAVFYDGDLVLGGGIVSRVQP
ncbi:MAG: tRNA 2-thiouridine(34) synthase MnmA [Clostridiaceae bacterium]|jgi:tRNA-specific 2-thiouridylase|nr:tRNA 2-thiouridine(34) synthase MnmA [Clostridiaceae bacterium]